MTMEKLDYKKIAIVLFVLLLASLTGNILATMKIEVQNPQTDIPIMSADKAIEDYELLRKERDSLYQVTQLPTQGEIKYLNNQPNYKLIKQKTDENIKTIKNFDTPDLQYFLWDVYGGGAE